MHTDTTPSITAFTRYATATLLAFTTSFAMVACEPPSNDCGQLANGSDCLDTCEYEGAIYVAGESFEATDDCNTCTCTSGGVACTAMACIATCDYAGQTHFAGDSFDAGDDCNTCSCLEDGQVICTQMACPENTCLYAGVDYQQGETFAALDGCNTCSCTEDGIACTDQACTCDPDDEWYRNYVSVDPAECALIDYVCAENTTAFTNECGCGCEQSYECPQWFNCMPPAECDPQQIAEDCPYSDIAY